MRHTSDRQKNWLYFALIIFLTLNIATWQFSHRQQPGWPNVPKPPSKFNLTSSFLGDEMMAYRVWALALQNFGNAGGNYMPLKDYNYDNVTAWFHLLDDLDPHSDFVPLLAAYYFGATQNPKEQLPPVIGYLEKVGVRPEGEKWRWLAQAMYLARHRVGDMDEALRISKKLGSVYREGMPAWTLQAQALITTEMGDKEAAYVMLKTMLASDTEHMQANEINFMVDYICTKILTPAQAKVDKTCEAYRP